MNANASSIQFTKLGSKNIQSITRQPSVVQSKKWRKRNPKAKQMFKKKPEILKYEAWRERYEKKTWNENECVRVREMDNNGVAVNGRAHTAAKLFYYCS